MKKLFLLLAAFAPMAFAQMQDPIAPMLETNYSNGVKDRLTGDLLPKGNWAFDIRIENPNNEPIVCLGTKFWAYIDSYGKGCRSGSSEGIWIEFANNGASFFSLEANEVNTSLKEYGYKERVERENSGITKYEYCGREPFTFNCGYYCDKDHKYNDSWKIFNDNGGYKKFYCKKNGETELKEVYCTSKYKASDSWKERIGNKEYMHTCQSSGDILTQEIATWCDEEHKSPDTWEKNIDNGKIIYNCSSSGNISTNVTCDQSPKSYTPEGESCVPSPCLGGIPHGSRGNTILIPHGTTDFRCEYGGWVDQQIQCNADSIKENNSCRLGNSCQGVGHLATKAVVDYSCGTCARGPGVSSVYQCVDGSLNAIGKTGYCEAVPGCRGPGGREP